MGWKLQGEPPSVTRALSAPPDSSTDCAYLPALHTCPRAPGSRAALHQGAAVSSWGRVHGHHPAAMLVQKLSGACFQTGLERYQHSSLISHLQGCRSHSISAHLCRASPACVCLGYRRTLVNARPTVRHLLPPCDEANAGGWPNRGPLAQTSSAVHPAQQRL